MIKEYLIKNKMNLLENNSACFNTKVKKVRSLPLKEASEMIVLNNKDKSKLNINELNSLLTNTDDLFNSEIDKIDVYDNLKSNKKNKIKENRYIRTNNEFIFRSRIPTLAPSHIVYSKYSNIKSKIPKLA